jgi:GDP/UDP-N,N'-diacetylbacillosamine 2-epimerase (hydrolysing)
MKIIAVTGARSEYDLLSDVYKKLEEKSEVDFSVLITGPHFSEKFGRTADYVLADGFRVADQVYSLLDSDTKHARVLSLGNQISGFVQTFLREQPDIVLVAGDREEALSVSAVCAYMDIRVAHFFGGDIVKDGNIDNSIRYAASKLAHIHFPTLKEHKETLLKLGEDDWRIFQVGNPALDRLVNTKQISRPELFENLRIHPDWNIEKYCVLIQHSIITEVSEQNNHIRETLEAIRESGLKCFINSPNSDAGTQAIIDAFHEYSSDYPFQFKLFKNLDRENFINLLRHSACLIGNSSAGILEAPTLGLPVVNVGSRQVGRIHASNVLFVGNEKSDILDALTKSTYDLDYIESVRNVTNPYGDGKSSQEIVEILLNLDGSKDWLHKNISY